MLTRALTGCAAATVVVTLTAMSIAARAVRQWRFDPATTRDVLAVECSVELAVKFEL